MQRVDSDHRDEAQRLLDGLTTLQTTRYVPPPTVAAIQAALDDRGSALASLEPAWDARDTRLVYMKDDRRWDPLRGEPRFANLLRRMHLDTYGTGQTANSGVALSVRRNPREPIRRDRWRPQRRR